ncbi:putative RING-H2 finger protein ATL21A isoform X2 [Salvia miltiorrhiza]|uniref:putative RING-H2 finger protein ATL21A isoform X2 n=1 Tax=Salvia miltiorrhiza TaxID=226208 RepID=UPI0025AC2FD1|nr:putative RING-H2 finger protein ATL21A isoform X2 [Salvia miltiorrhiza]
MAMDALILCSLLVLSLTTASSTSCKATKCSLLSPEIRPPFRIVGSPCGLSEFTLSCDLHNQTTIRFDGTGDLVVKAISYHSRRLTLADPNNCVHQVFFNLDLSLTPFTYYHSLHRYTYLNCSSKLLGGIEEEVPCLSGANHHVYVVEPSFPLPPSCSAVKTVAIPFSYSRYLSDGSFGLGLTWSPTREYYNYTVSVMAVVLIVGMVLYAKYGGQLNQQKGEETLGEYEALKVVI